MRKKCDKCGRFVSSISAFCKCGNWLEYEYPVETGQKKSLKVSDVCKIYNFRVIDFNKQPLLLGQLEKYANDKNREIGEIIIGFCALGYKEYLNGRNER